MKKDSEVNHTIFQFFHWYFPKENKLWEVCKAAAPRLADIKVTHVWLPPAYKSAKGNDEPGYAVYDLYDLGEFEQKGSVETKHGTKEQYLSCIKTLQENGIKVLVDVIVNHLFDGDFNEDVPVVEVSDEDRNKIVSGEHIINTATGFRYPARNGRYSDFVWNHTCFTGVCHDGKIKMILHEYSRTGWNKLSDKEHGNFDFLMADDVDFRNPFVRKELMRWGQWYMQTTGVDGFRLDALKHIPHDFLPQWLDHLSVVCDKEYFVIGEYWNDDLESVLHFLQFTSRRIKLFDVPLHFNLQQAGTEPGYDLRKVFDGTLVQACPDSAITFVDNHDTQPLQSLESTVATWFQPHAYALILLRREGIPCVFYPAVFGAEYSGKDKNGEHKDVKLFAQPLVETMMKIRNGKAYGDQTDYFVEPHLIGWVRHGADDKPGAGCVVVLSTEKEGAIEMSLGASFSGKIFYDATGSIKDPVTLGDDGQAKFYVQAKSLSVWIEQQ